jgi:hypothetical protein
VTIDTTGLTIEGQVSLVLDEVRKREGKST